MDPIRDFFADLKSPDPSIRFSVLSRIEDLAWTSAQQQALQELFSQEKDPGIRFHMQKVLARFGNSDKTSASAAEIDELLKKPDRDEVSLALMLESVKKPEALVVTMSLREASWPNFSAYLLPSVLKFLKKFGSFEDSANIEMLCRHHDPRVLSAAIEALEKISPDRLKDLIVPLLINGNFGIRSRAVRLLYRWDPSEALRHYEAMLFSNLENEKQAALFYSFFFPFKDIESLLLRFISVETDADMINKAGLIFMANPDRQVPSRLLEVRQGCTGDKFKLVDTILKGVLQSLYQARIVNAAPEQMLEVLENHYQEKRIKLYIERYSHGLQSGEAPVRLKAALKMGELAKHNVNEARELVAKFLARERDEKIKQQVEQYLRAGTVVAEKAKPPQTKKLQDLDSQQRQEFFDGISKINFSTMFSQISSAFNHLPVEDQVSALKTIERFGSKNESEVAVRCLQSDNQEVLTAAIDCLSVICPESLHPFLPQLIKHRFDEVKLAAIKVFALFDKKQAISLIEKMLFAIKPLQRRNAIFCLAHFDFHSISQILLAAMRNESDPENLQQIASILKSNSDEELFYRIFADAKSCKPGQKEFYDTLCMEMARQIESSEQARSKDLLYKTAEAKCTEESRIKSERTAYQLEKIQKIRKNVEKNTVFDASLIRFTIFAYITGAIITAMLWFLFLAPPATVGTESGKKQSTKAVASSVTIIGTIINVDKAERKIVIEDSQPKKYEFILPKISGELPEPGKKMHVQLKIISENEGKALAELLTAF